MFLNRSAFRGSESFTGTTLRAFNTRFTRKSASVDRLRLPTIATQLKSSFQKKNGEGLSAFSVFATSHIERSSCELRKESEGEPQAERHDTGLWCSESLLGETQGFAERSAVQTRIHAVKAGMVK